MKYCTKCGAQMNDDDLFCPKCGNKSVVQQETVKPIKVDQSDYADKNLIDYISGANSLELDAYGIRKVIEVIDTQIQKANSSINALKNDNDRLNNIIANSEKQMRQYKKSEMNYVKFYEKTKFHKVSFWDFYHEETILVFYTIYAIVYVVLGFLTFRTPLGRLLWGSIINIVIALLLPLVVFFVIYVVSQNAKAKAHNMRYEKDKKAYEEKIAQQKKAYDDEQDKKQAEYMKKHQAEITVSKVVIDENNITLAQLEKAIIPTLELEKQKAKDALDEQLIALDKYYSLGIVYPKYQGLVQIGTILDYLQAGRTNRLTGPHGAYNMYEREATDHLIIEKLDDLIDINQQILKSQYVLIKAVEKVGNNVTALGKSIENVAFSNAQGVDSINANLKSLKKSTDTANYYNKVAANNSDILVNYERYRSYVIDGTIVY